MDAAATLGTERRRPAVRPALPWVLAIVLLAGIPAAAGPAEIFKKTCATCHGAKGEGSLAQKTPSIASMPAWYIARQLHKFRTDIRGADKKDLEGLKMRAIAHTLKDEEVKGLAEFISKLPRTPTRHTLKGDTAEGRTLFREYCMECHRYNGRGEFVFGSPPLTGLQDWYIRDQLLKFRSGVRGAHPDDEQGAKMHKRTNALTARQLLDIASFIGVLAGEHDRETPKK
ncbi:MAG: cytochrome c [Akkermansiaceae bacterium]|nr:cytochrome c [Akkermansiaceae bacterium]NNM31121.1 cytochrome c [Akkermansiaceae bacterium]